MINNGLKFPNNLYLEAKNENMSRYEGYIYKITLSYNIRDDNAVLISLITKKTYIEQLWRLFALYFLISQINKVCKFILIKYGNTF